jgi:hypothetical protein
MRAAHNAHIANPTRITPNYMPSNNLHAKITPKSTSQKF